IDRLAEAQHRDKSDTQLDIGFRDRGRKTHDLIIAKKIRKELGGHVLFRELDAYVHRGTRLGIVGNNASGKTTLLRTLAGVLPPDGGAVRHATDLRVVLFDQQREQLDPDKTLRRTLAPYGDKVYDSGRETHVIAWASRFGFRRDQLDIAVGGLSGGEQARVLMAVMMQQQADVLLLDEPTNDLDIPSVEVLESALIDFPGAIVLITHDRHMLDRVCTDLIGLHSDGKGHWGNYGSVAQWQESDTAGQAAPPVDENAAAPPARRETSASKSAGLTYHEKQEWESIEDQVIEAEEEVSRLEAALSDPDLVSNHEALNEAYEEHQAAVERVNALYDRWQELDGKRGK
ncbi:ABC-F family ATP-binding cassette domain-containing protein, partial [Candidatus Bipolaricaulota bacterium]|nr:ABC-F family ATP-binding cassette domain-containing protein [Candidatus Bipolaricaulota bacterium]